MSESRTARVLVVEDSLSQAKRLQTILESAGFRVTVAPDGQAGWERFASEAFDLVLSDVMMPGLTGYDLCRRVKSDPRGASVPFVLLTSLTKPLDLARGLECGADN
jgi:two-component system cell cycle response regulator